MSTAIATATEVEPERNFTAKEILTRGDGFLWQAVEQWEIHLGEPRLCGGRWLAGCRLLDDCRIMEFGDSPVEAVKNVLQKIGDLHESCTEN